VEGGIGMEGRTRGTYMTALESVVS
jgi:hypothetical protein